MSFNNFLKIQARIGTIKAQKIYLDLIGISMIILTFYILMYPILISIMSSQLRYKLWTISLEYRIYRSISLYQIRVNCQSRGSYHCFLKSEGLSLNSYFKNFDYTCYELNNAFYSTK
jgi:hypothetical protein